MLRTVQLYVPESFTVGLVVNTLMALNVVVLDGMSERKLSKNYSFITFYFSILLSDNIKSWRTI